MNEKIKNTVKAVQMIREGLSANKNELSVLKAEFAEQNSDLMARISDGETLLKDAEAELRKLAVDSFDGVNKKPFPGVGIQESETVDVQYDELNALEWCKEHDMFLLVNNAAFTAYCKLEGSSLPHFVNIEREKTIKATIDKDLSKAVEAMKEVA